ncbi:MAG: ABC transporter permease [Cyclobacteriaceae bacterium]|nr:ABC transporter permease [Cyclobacteriaceae bacterium HetDA_MAG_MS6]
MLDLPPRIGLRFLRWFCKDEFLEEIEGDIVELFYLSREESPRKARFFFLWNVLRSFRWTNLKKTQTDNSNMNLLSNYTKIYFRRFRKETTHFIVNIFGLAMGLAILFFILMFVYDEQKIDSFYSKSERIYRVVEKSTTEEDGTHHYFCNANPLGEALKSDFSGIEETARMTYFGSHVLVKDEVRIADRDWVLATKGIFKILDFDIVSGDPLKDFQGQAGIVLTEDVAKNLFGRTDVVGEVLDGSRFGKIEVLAVMRSMPRNSTYQFKEIYIPNFSQFSERFQRFFSSWDTRFMHTWVLLKEGTSPEEIYTQKESFLEKYLDAEIKAEHDFYFLPLTDIHLGATNVENGGPGPLLAIPLSDRQFVSMILLMGFFVIFIAALNYINLSSVQALKRTLEASMRKINGATNRQLVGQLFFETLFTVLISYVLSIAIVAILFPFFQEIANKDFHFSLLFSFDLIGYHLFTMAVIWIVSAFLPALYYSKLKRSLLILKNAFSGKGDMLRKSLVGIQYILSMFLVIGSIVIYRQLNFVQSKDLGFDNNNLLVLDINSGSARQSFKNIVDGIKKSPDVINVSASSRVPGEWKDLPVANLSLNLNEDPVEANHYAVDHYWLDTYQIELITGHNFTGLDQTDSLHILINEQAVKMLALDEPIGANVWVNTRRDSVRMKVIGVIEDFHFESLYELIGPVVLTTWNNHVRSLDYFTVRYAQNPQRTIGHIEDVNATFDPDTPAEINFLDMQWERFYRAEKSRSMIILIASVVSIIISAFGLFGLINFTTERKTKEIGIRKVMGATILNIIYLIIRDYMILLLISLVISAPVAYWLLNDWLSDFAYRINLSPDVFLFAFLVILVISFSTVLSRIFKIAKANPVHAIRYE